MAEFELTEARGDFIDGAFQIAPTTSGEIPLEDPGNTAAALGAFPFAAEAVDQAVDSAQRAWPSWRDTKL